MIGFHIKRLRKDRNWTQDELAERSGVNITYLGTVERGTRNVSVDTLERIIHALEIEVSDFFNMDTIPDGIDLETYAILEEHKSLLLNLKNNDEMQSIHKIMKDIIQFSKRD
jgi:transcriptional regulator with XRE-family HTH domain